ncbi:MAG: hypothetical protein ACJ776_07305 [Chloroflexota bacterium]
MTPDQITDRKIRSLFERRAAAARPGDLAAAIVSDTRQRSQRSAGSVALRDEFDRRATLPRIIMLVAATVAVVGTAFGIGFGGGAPHAVPSPAAIAPLATDPRSQSPMPVQSDALIVASTPTGLVPGRLLPPGDGKATGFQMPFAYRNPEGSGLAVMHDWGVIVTFAAGTNDEFGRDPNGAAVPGSRGVSVSAFNGAFVHPCPGVDGGSSRIPIQVDPTGFLEDLEGVAGIGVVEAMPTTLDGRPAMTASIDPSRDRCETADFHVASGPSFHEYVMLSMPSRIWVTKIGEQTVVINAWAASREGLDRWLPTAEAFVQSMHFED